MQLITRKSECRSSVVVKSPREIPESLKNDYPGKGCITQVRHQLSKQTKYKDAIAVALETIAE